ncbi:L-threonine dehydrogenase [Photobacterium sagamiensis]|uniref:L-threonine dehydrogenase n=1 Tax=Photobacterium sagamiensis TaxID=2910241 RepID=UPI003D0B6603
MATTAFFMPSVNIMGAGCLAEAIDAVKGYGFKKGLIVTDKVLSKMGVAENIKAELAKRDIDTVVFDGAQPNPTIGNIHDGLAILNSEECDFIVSLGGGSPHDCAKGVAMIKANGCTVNDLEGLDQTEKPMFPLIAINTTAGTASEMTRFCIITDEERHMKMAIVDKHATPLMSVNDPILMTKKPANLTAATGMDALTHAVEAYVSIAASPITDAVALKAISMVQEHLRTATHEGDNIEAREGMAYAQFMAGMAFNNASVGYVHAIAHQLGGLYDLPHGVLNAILLPHVERFNAKACPERMRDIAVAMGVDISSMSVEEGAEAAIEAMAQLSKDVNIPVGLKELGAKEEDVAKLIDQALVDACAATNPIQATHEELSAVLLAAF